MKLLELLRKGFGYVLLSMGVSRPPPKTQPRGGSSQASGEGDSRRG